MLQKQTNHNPFDKIDERLNKIECLLLDIKQQPSRTEQTSDADELLTVKEAAKFLRLSAPTIYSLISKRDIPFQKRTKRVYFSKNDLLKYLREGRRKTNSEISSNAIDYLKKRKEEL
ncbi:MAG: helix-turn-helix domain-containing protein [Bacteroidota bacterium]